MENIYLPCILVDYNRGLFLTDNNSTNIRTTAWISKCIHINSGVQYHIHRIKFEDFSKIKIASVYRPLLLNMSIRYKLTFRYIFHWDKMKFPPVFHWIFPLLFWAPLTFIVNLQSSYFYREFATELDYGLICASLLSKVIMCDNQYMFFNKVKRVWLILMPHDYWLSKSTVYCKSLPLIMWNSIFMNLITNNDCEVQILLSYHKWIMSVQH